MKTKVAREVDQSYLKRADSVEASQVGTYLDSIALALHQSLDSWRYNNGPREDVAVCIDALVAMWTSVERRDL